jgi:hypothetical protein
MVTPERRFTTLVPGPCRIETRTEWVRPPSSSVIHVPAVTHLETVQAMVRPPGWRTETIPPVYETILEEVVVRPARREWRPARPGAVAPAPGADGWRAAPTGEVLCLVEIPAEVRTVPRQVMIQPARTVSVPTPPVFAPQEQVVVDVPAHDERRDDPGEKRETRVEICQPPHEELRIEAPTFADAPRTRIIASGRSAWREVACRPPRPRPRPCGCRPPPPTVRPPPGPAAPPRPAAPVGDLGVRRLQEALAAKGYFHGPVDGLFTQETAQAMRRFQHDRRLPEGRYTGETADALGLRQ